MGRKGSGVIVVANNANFARNFTDPETGQQARLEPGLNEIPGNVVERIADSDQRFAVLIDEGRGNSLKSESGDAVKKMTKAVQDGSKSIAELPSTEDMLRVVRQTDDKDVLVRIFNETNRGSVRSLTAQRLRQFGIRGF